MLSLIAAAALFTAAQEQSRTEVSAESQAESQAPQNEEADRVICRRERVVGSNRPQRICMTRREWEHNRSASRDMAREFQQRGGHADLPIGRD